MSATWSAPVDVPSPAEALSPSSCALSSRPRHTRSSRQRPCDTCRVRKTRCVRQQEQQRCVLCAFHDQPCTFVQGPTSRTRPTPPQAQDVTQTPGSGRSLGASRRSPASPPTSAPSQPGSGTSPSSAPTGSEPDATTVTAIAQPDTDMLNNTLGLHLKTHAEYVGWTDIRLSCTASGPSSLPNERRVDDRTVFLVHADESSASEAQRIADLDAIEAIARPWGPTLVDLYFRIVHPSFPILHKDVFVTKHRASHRHFAPSLLAAVYLVALDWQLYDTALVSEDSLPDSRALERLAMRTIAQDMRRPKLSTLEAGLLLLHRSRRAAEGGFVEHFASSRIFAAQLVAMAQDLGIHLDCSSWSIPAWEIGLRRRLAWALYTQDRWGSYINGRPFLIHESDWTVVPCTWMDYPELEPDHGHQPRTATSAGWEVFLRQAELAQMLSHVVGGFYSAAACGRGGSLDRMNIMEMVELAKPMGLRIREWQAALPQHLLLDSCDTLRSREPSVVGALHLACVAVEITLYRALVRAMTPDMPQPLHAALVQTAKAKVQTGIDLLSALRPEHTASFWGSAASHQVAEIGALINLLRPKLVDMSEGDELWCAARMEDLRWALRVRGNAASFAKDALRLLGRDSVELRA